VARAFDHGWRLGVRGLSQVSHCPRHRSDVGKHLGQSCTSNVPGVPYIGPIGRLTWSACTSIAAHVLAGGAGRRPRTARPLASCLILRATATTPTSRPRAPVADHTTRHHGMYRWNPSPDARECAPSHRRRPGAARSFRPPPHPSTGPFHSRKDSRSRKHLAADPWTPPRSRLVSASIG
jgi:hypothetical protein